MTEDTKFTKISAMDEYVKMVEATKLATKTKHPFDSGMMARDVELFATAIYKLEHEGKTEEELEKDVALDIKDMSAFADFLFDSYSVHKDLVNEDGKVYTNYNFHGPVSLETQEKFNSVSSYMSPEGFATQVVKIGDTYRHAGVLMFVTEGFTEESPETKRLTASITLRKLSDYA